MSTMPSSSKTLVAIDTGGTFTDFVVLSSHGIRTHKVLSTPTDPSLAITRGLKDLGIHKNFSMIHGSTVATNALLEGKGAKVLLITTKGFEDVLEIGRQNRAKLYDLEIERPQPLVKTKFRLGVKERIDAQGKKIIPLSQKELQRLLEKIKTLSPESIAVCLLSAYKNPNHEKTLEQQLKKLKIPLSLSSKISPEFREYERSSTTCVNAYVAPVMSRYLQRLKRKIPQPIRVMQSNGGALSIREASEESIHTLLSGPAGGALGALAAGKKSKIEKMLSFDMGGTSTDMSLIDGTLEMTSESEVGGYPIKTPMIKIDTIGAGGGSLAWVDPGGALRVGPQSAGADPGPICYGKGGTRVTITDAHVWLGRIPQHHFLGGTMPLYRDKIEIPLKKLAQTLRLSELETAQGILSVANANMAKALRVLSLERGFDPREFTLVPFGGAGSLHACELAEILGMSQVIIPHHPGLLSAVGMAYADWRRDYVATVFIREMKIKSSRLNKYFRRLEQKSWMAGKKEGFSKKQIQFKRQIDVRYVGQGYELTIEDTKNIRHSFEREHQKAFGYLHKKRPIEIVNLRLQAKVPTSSSSSPLLTSKISGGEKNNVNMKTAAPISQKHTIFWKKKFYKAYLYQREYLKNEIIIGPAIIVEYSSTTFIPPGWSCQKPKGSLNLTLKKKKLFDKL